MVGLGDTIVALSTPFGSGAIHIVRLSGTTAVDIVGGFCALSSGGSLSGLPARFLASCSIFIDDVLIDQALVVRFVAPHSFTGEDLVELHLHGNMQIVDLVISACMGSGARLASRGEFSRRAFLNGKMDLTQVEALSDVISAESSAGVALAQLQLKGGLRDRFDLFRTQLIEVLARMELELDFVEEGYEFADRELIELVLEGLMKGVESLLAGYRSSNLLRHGARVLLMGSPNAGKSSLFNALVGFDRAIVSGTPGTTRDYIEERVTYGGCTFYFIDSAGLRESGDGIEREGVERSFALVGAVDLVLYVVDGSSLSCGAEVGRFEELRMAYPQQAMLLVFSKADLFVSDEPQVACSVFDGRSISSILDLLVESFKLEVSSQVALLTRRQFQLLMDIRELILAISPDIFDSTEVLAAELRRLLVPMSELSGVISSEEILNEVFGAFCIGK